MKLQQLSVIFILIILPIAIVIETYVNNLIDVSNKQKNYNAILYNSTYDAVRAYQINTLNNSFASVNTSRDRDINASVNSFFTSLASGFSSSGYTKNDLKDYIPAMLFTLYDGYFVYGPYENSAKISGGKAIYNDEKNQYNRQIEYGVKPYTYYSCEYADGANNQNGTYDIIVNYTLDNYISVSGWYTKNNTKQYITKAGYYINPDKIVTLDSTQNPNPDTREVVLRVNQNDSDSNEMVTLKPETLYEYISFYDDYKVPGSLQTLYRKQNGSVKKYRYINYNEEKYYYDEDLASNLGNIKSKINEIKQTYPNATDEDVRNALINEPYNISKTAVDGYFNTTFDKESEIPIFWLDGNFRTYINSYTLATLNEFTWKNGSNSNNNKTITNIDDFKDVNYYYYYKKAKEFSTYVKDALENIDLGYDETTGTYKNVKTASFNNKYSIITRDGDGVTINDISESQTTDAEKVNVSHTKYSYSDVKNKVFDLSPEGNAQNDPEMEDSAFNRHRIDVIVSSVESSLTSAIASFNQFKSASYSYRMPTISEDDWNKVANNLCTISFMQGLGVGNYKYYNNYAIVTNTKNKEFVSKDAIYVQDTSNSDSYTSTGNYHNPRCNEYNSINHTEDSVIGYRTIDYEIQSYEHSYGNNNQKEVSNYYLQPGTGSYECVVSLTKNYMPYDDLMSLKTGTTKTKTDDDIYHSLAISKAYVQALAREKNAESKIYEFYNKE